MRSLAPSSRTTRLGASTLIGVALVFSLGGMACKKKAAPPDVAEAPMPTEVVPPKPTRTEADAVAEIVRNFQRVHFDFDSTNLVDESDDALSANAKILQEFPEIRVEVQGHADERGTTDYNLALGQRRAKTIQDRLTNMGVSAGQITLVSYGEERPLDESSGERAWSKNRRAEFRVLRSPQGADVEGTVE